MSSRRLAIFSIIAAWAAVVLSLVLGVALDKNVTILVVFTGIVAISTTSYWAIRARRN